MIYKTPQDFLRFSPQQVQEWYWKWKEHCHHFYFADGEVNTIIKQIPRFTPANYDLECVRMDGHNSSFILTKYGYAVNVAAFSYNLANEITFKKGDGVVYIANPRGEITCDNMKQKKMVRKSRWSYKELCDKYLKSSQEQLADIASQKKFWG